MKRPTNFRIDDEHIAAWREEAERSGIDLTEFVEEAANTFTAADGRRAHRAVAAAIASGKLKRQPCEVCGSDKVEAHHDDYAKPLEVRWLCRLDHRRWHKEHPSGIKWDLFNIRLDDQTKARWQAAATERGFSSLAEFVKACVEAKIADLESGRSTRLRGRVEGEETRPMPPPPTVPPPIPARQQPQFGGKVFKGPDFKPESTRKRK